ncbi:MAG TPA: hypothetical protein DCS63_11035 [Elusimicrobia bacterium]|nr:hypothetical protein [Elusimicrobiota bacterium]
MEILGSAESLKRAILEKAGSESSAVMAAALSEAESILASARERASKDRAARLEAALAEGARRREMMMASVPLEAGRLRALRLEALLDAIKEEALARLKAEAGGAGGSAVAAGLAAQAVRVMEGNEFVITLGAGDVPKAAGLAAEIERLAGRGPLAVSFEEDPGLDGGVRVRDGGGRQYWDNSFRARLERSWPVLRGRLLPDGAGVNRRKA